MEKIKLNTQIINMRKYIKMAKIHSINRLTKEAKILQNRNGNAQKVEKCKRKAQRCLEEISIIKKVKNDDLSKKVLCKVKDWKEILQKKDASLQDRCLALLATFKSVQDEVDNFYRSNVRLVPKIPSLIEDMEKSAALRKQKKKDAKKKTQNIKNGEKNISSNPVTENSCQTKEGAISISSNTPRDGILKDVSRSEDVSEASGDDGEYFAGDRCSKIRQMNKQTNQKSGNSENATSFANEDKDETQSSESPNDNENMSEASDMDEECFENRFFKILKNNKGTNENSDKSKNVILFSKKDVNETPSPESPNEMSDMDEGTEDINDRKQKVSDIQASKTRIHKSPDIEDEFSQPSSARKNLSNTKKRKNIKKKILKKSTESSTLSPSKEKIDESFKNKKRLKAVTSLNLDELKDLDEIPIEQMCESEEEIEGLLKKKKKDSFFLNHDGDSDSEDSKESDSDERKFQNRSQASNEFQNI